MATGPCFERIELLCHVRDEGQERHPVFRLGFGAAVWTAATLEARRPSGGSYPTERRIQWKARPVGVFTAKYRQHKTMYRPRRKISSNPIQTGHTQKIINSNYFNAVLNPSK